MPELRAEPAPGVVVRWDLDAVAALSGGAGPAPAPVWTLEGDLAPAHSALRVLSAALEDGSALLVAAARPAGAAGHDADEVAACIVGEGGEPEPLEQVLFSTEYAGDGSVRRAGVELYRAGEDYPLRAAGDAVSGAGGAGDSTVLDFRVDGRSGRATLDLVRADQSDQ